MKKKNSFTINSTGSSKGRGTRAAGWFDDLIRDRAGKTEGGGSGGEGGGGEGGAVQLQSLVLEGGITGWVAGGAEYVEWMVGYEEGYWRRPKEARGKA